MSDGIEIAQATPAVQPPASPGPEFLYDWWAADPSDPALGYLVHLLGDGPPKPTGWDCARLSTAAYVYRERATDKRYLAKFYAVKTPRAAERRAEHELAANRAALDAGLADGPGRACGVLGAWRGVLFLEYVDGLTLDDLVAVRRDRPGTLGPALDAAAGLLATLHRSEASPQRQPVERFASRGAIAEARSFLSDLVRSSVLSGEALISAGLARQLDAWSTRPSLTNFRPTLIHGDATTTNFVFPSPAEVVAID